MATAGAAPQQRVAFPPVYVTNQVPTGDVICDLQFETRCTRADTWHVYNNGSFAPCDSWTLGPEFQIPEVYGWCLTTGCPLWDEYGPPHDYVICRDSPLDAAAPNDIPPGLGQWRIANLDGKVVAEFDGIWIRDGRRFARLIGRLDDWKAGRAEPTCTPVAGHDCWTAHEMWTYLLREQKRADCPRLIDGTDHPDSFED